MKDSKGYLVTMSSANRKLAEEGAAKMGIKVNAYINYLIVSSARGNKKLEWDETITTINGEDINVSTLRNHNVGK